MKTCENRHPLIVFENVKRSDFETYWVKCPLCEALDRLASLKDEHADLLREVVERDHLERSRGVAS